MACTRRLGALWLLLSVALHGWLMSQVRKPPPTAVESAPSSETVDLWILDRSSPAPRATPPPKSAAADQPKRRPLRPLRSRAPRRAPALQAQPLPEQPPPQAAPRVEHRDESSRAVAAPAVRIDPLAAARSVFDPLSPSHCQDNVEPGPGDRETRDAEPGALARERLAAETFGVDAEPTETRAAPTLQPGPHGSLIYEGRAFTAIIDRDGVAHFDDHSSVERYGLVNFKFDITEAVMRRRGEDPYRSLKRRFLEDTRELRHARARAARERALEQLQHRLGRIKHEGLTIAQQHERVFALWNECANDEVGSVAQRAIEAFVREAYPQGTPLAFAHEQLLAFRSRTLGARTFDPYGTLDQVPVREQADAG